MLKITFFTFVLILLLGELNCKAEDISLAITNLNLDRGVLQFDFMLKNNTPGTLWVCSDMHDKGDISYEIRTDSKGKLVSIRFGNALVPDNVFLEEPIWAKFIRLEQSKVFKNTVRVELPLFEINPIKKKGPLINKKVWYADTLSLEIGVYRSNLEQLKAVCCRDDSDSAKVFVSCFWAQENNEEVVRSEVGRLTIPVEE